MVHVSVLLHESIEGLGVRPGDVFLDCTLGGGGHSLEVCRLFGNSVSLVGLDADSDAIARSSERLAQHGCGINAVNASFRDLDKALDGLGISQVDRVLMDLGLSSNQLEESGRGFAFRRDEPLLMTFAKDPEPGAITASQIVNHWDEENIATVLKGYGDERYAKRFARAIVLERAKASIETTGQLADLIARASPPAYRHGKIHPATRTFQALRIAVNDELQALREGLETGFARLRPGGRIAVISFHSGEDRIVKNFFRDLAKEGKAAVITKKPIRPNDEEERENPRSRSAKLRILEKVSS